MAQSHPLRWNTNSELAVDSSNNSHIVYRNYTAGAVKNAYNGGAAWDTEGVDANGGDNEGTKIAVGPDGSPQIAYSSERE